MKDMLELLSELDELKAIDELDVFKDVEKDDVLIEEALTEDIHDREKKESPVKNLLEEKVHEKNSLDEIIETSIKKIEKEEKKFIDRFYSVVKLLYSHMKSAVSYFHSIFDEYSVIVKNMANRALNEYYNFIFAQTRGFVYKKMKGGDPVLDVVAFNEVTGIDYDEKIELMRASKYNILTNNNYTDPEAKERWNLWVLFSFNQIMSFFYYDNAI